MVKSGTPIIDLNVQMMKPYSVPRFEVELAPHIYFNHFTPGIYAVSDNKKLTDGVKPAAWAYAVGGDLAFSYKVAPRAAIFLRPSLSWLSNEAFEGISSDPLWRVNLMAYTTVGLRLDLGTKRLALKPRPMHEQTNTVVVTETKIVEREKPATEKQNEVVKVVERNDPQAELLKQLKNEAMPVVYFRRGFAVIDAEYNDALQAMLALARKYESVPVMIEGWCDATGTEKINALLSQQRANAVADWLIQNGVASGRISVRGAGVDEANGTSNEARRAQLRFVVK